MASPQTIITLPIAVGTALGLTLSQQFKRKPLHPLATGSILFLLTKAPENVRGPVLALLGRILNPTGISRVITTFQWLVTFGLVRLAHNFLTDLTRNNFRLSTDKDKWDWPKEIAVVTGAAGGIGSLITAQLAAKGVTVLAVDIAPGLSSNLKDNKKVHYYKCDITSRQAVMDMAAQIQSEHGNPTILVNNAGICYTHGILEASEESLHKTFDINSISQYWTIQAFLPAMIKAKKGHIAITASMVSFMGNPGMVPYCGSKAAVLAMYEGLEQELRVLYNAPEIKLTITHPTFVNTNLTNKMKAYIHKDNPIIEPEDVSNAIVKQILSRRSGQIILSGGLPPVAELSRGLPHWLTYSALTVDPSRNALHKRGVEQKMDSST